MMAALLQAVGVPEGEFGVRLVSTLDPIRVHPSEVLPSLPSTVVHVAFALTQSDMY